MANINTFIVTDTFDGRTIERLTRVSTVRLARKHAQRIASETGINVSLIRTDSKGERHLVDFFRSEYAGRPT